MYLQNKTLRICVLQIGPLFTNFSLSPPSHNHFREKYISKHTHTQIEAMASAGKEVSNKQLILRDYVTGSPK